MNIGRQTDTHKHARSFGCVREKKNITHRMSNDHYIQK